MINMIIIDEGYTKDVIKSAGSLAWKGAKVTGKAAYAVAKPVVKAGYNLAGDIGSASYNFGKSALKGTGRYLKNKTNSSATSDRAKIRGMLD